jgi:hypothetical protein
MSSLGETPRRTDAVAVAGTGRVGSPSRPMQCRSCGGFGRRLSPGRMPPEGRPRDCPHCGVGVLREVSPVRRTGKATAEQPPSHSKQLPSQSTASSLYTAVSESKRRLSGAVGQGSSQNLSFEREQEDFSFPVLSTLQAKAMAAPSPSTLNRPESFALVDTPPRLTSSTLRAMFQSPVGQQGVESSYGLHSPFIHGQQKTPHSGMALGPGSGIAFLGGGLAGNEFSAASANGYSTAVGNVSSGSQASATDVTIFRQMQRIQALERQVSLQTITLRKHQQRLYFLRNVSAFLAKTNRERTMTRYFVKWFTLLSLRRRQKVVAPQSLTTDQVSPPPRLQEGLNRSQMVQYSSQERRRSPSPQMQVDNDGGRFKMEDLQRQVDRLTLLNYDQGEVIRVLYQHMTEAGRSMDISLQGLVLAPFASNEPPTEQPAFPSPTRALLAPQEVVGQPVPAHIPMEPPLPSPPRVAAIPILAPTTLAAAPSQTVTSSSSSSQTYGPPPMLTTVRSQQSQQMSASAQTDPPPSPLVPAVTVSDNGVSSASSWVQAPGRQWEKAEARLQSAAAVKETATTAASVVPLPKSNSNSSALPPIRTSVRSSEQTADLSLGQVTRPPNTLSDGGSASKATSLKAPTTDPTALAPSSISVVTPNFPALEMGESSHRRTIEAEETTTFASIHNLVAPSLLIIASLTLQGSRAEDLLKTEQARRRALMEAEQIELEPCLLPLMRCYELLDLEEHRRLLGREESQFRSQLLSAEQERFQKILRAAADSMEIVQMLTLNVEDSQLILGAEREQRRRLMQEEIDELMAEIERLSGAGDHEL